MRRLRPVIERTRGALVRRLVAQHSANARAAASPELDDEQRARVAVLEERNRIARELHDVVAHNVSAMVVQAGAARRIADTDRPRVCEALACVEATGRETLAQMRRLLGALHDADEVPALAPQPALGELDQLGPASKTGSTPGALT